MNRNLGADIYDLYYTYCTYYEIHNRSTDIRENCDVVRKEITKIVNCVSFKHRIIKKVLDRASNRGGYVPEVKDTGMLLNMVRGDLKIFFVSYYHQDNYAVCRKIRGMIFNGSIHNHPKYLSLYKTDIIYDENEEDILDFFDKKLTILDRDILSLYCSEDISFRDICKRFDITRYTLTKKLKHFKKHICSYIYHD